jgi:LPPG:FO 2-phospho-L-lactate transferase
MKKVVALAGGVGGAKLADGLARALPPGNLTIIVNTGDDFEHLGMVICPDLDTVCYTLAGKANPLTGWGRTNETWQAMEVVGELGGPTWFQLGDSDLGLHLERTRRLRSGESLSQVTRRLCLAWDILPPVLPMSDDAAPTSVYTTEQGELSFQEYFVHQQCRPRVTGFQYHDGQRVRPAPGVLDALQNASLVVICPSNPWVSVAPILEVAGVRALLQSRKVVAVSPIIGGKAVRGPAAKMFSELGIEPSAFAVARYYGNLLTGFVLDEVDRDQAAMVQSMGIRSMVASTLIKFSDDRLRLALQVLEFGENL